jgi:uncharacterized protein (DUF305 family)
MSRRIVLFFMSGVAVLVLACGGDDSSRMGPTTPGAMTGAAAPGGMPGAMGGGMMVTGEFDYLTRMIPHHQEAIDAARILQAGTRRQQMRDFAAAIIRTQSAEVTQMEAWLAQWYPGRETSVDYQPMMRNLNTLSGDALDRAFFEDMIPHHMMAVMMSQQLLVRQLAQHPAIVPFATTIRDVQHAEIEMMRTWLREWFDVDRR